MNGQEVILDSLQIEKRVFIEGNVRLANTFYWGDAQDMYADDHRVYAIRSAQSRVNKGIQIKAYVRLGNRYSLGCHMEFNEYSFSQELILQNPTDSYSFPDPSNHEYFNSWLGFGLSHRYALVKKERSTIYLDHSVSFDSPYVIKVRRKDNFSTEFSLKYIIDSSIGLNPSFGIYLRTALNNYFDRGSYYPRAVGVSFGINL